MTIDRDEIREPNFEELANEFKPASPRIDPEETLAKMRTAFAAAEAYQQASNEASRYGDEDDCRLLAELSDTIREQLAVFFSLLRARIMANANPPCPADAVAAAANEVIEKLREQVAEVSAAHYDMQILLQYLTNGTGGEAPAPEDLELARLVGPTACSLPDHVARLGSRLRCISSSVDEIGAAPGLADLGPLL